MGKPLLTIITRACRRPKKLTRCIESVLAQTCQDVEQIFLVDKVGRHNENPILWANTQLETYADRVDGEYVYTLDDDGHLGDIETVESIKQTAELFKRPGVILVKTSAVSLGGTPGIWPKSDIWNIEWERGQRPEKWVGNGYCVVVRSDVWKKHIKAYQYAHGGDWMFITELCKDGSISFVRLNIIAAVGHGRGAGVLFEKCGRDWFEKVAKKFGIQQVNDGDWRLQLWRDK